MLLNLIEEKPCALSELMKETGLSDSTLTGKKGMLERLKNLKRIKQLTNGVNKGKWVHYNYRDLEYEIEQFLKEKEQVFPDGGIVSDTPPYAATELKTNYDKDFINAFENMMKKNNFYFIDETPKEFRKE